MGPAQGFQGCFLGRHFAEVLIWYVFEHQWVVVSLSTYTP